MSPVVHVSRLRRLRQTIGYCTSHTEFNQLTEINVPECMEKPLWPRRRSFNFTTETVNAEHESWSPQQQKPRILVAIEIFATFEVLSRLAVRPSLKYFVRSRYPPVAFVHSHRDE